MESITISKIDDYIVKRILGAGGQAIVYLAHNAAGEYYAIKVFENLKDLSNEVVNLKGFKHENIVLLHEYKADGKKYMNGNESVCSYAVLSFESGGELYDFISTGAFPEPVVRMYFEMLMNGIKEMHKKGVFHRDLKPENIFLSKEFVLKIADFGLSKNITKMTG
jgi:serine/threonine protein kinase